jgi:calcium-dependent protein kinase
LKKEPAERPTAAKALEDHWIQRHKVAKQELSLGFAVHDVVQLSESEADVQKELKANAADGVSVWDASMEGMLGKEFPILQIKSEKVIALSPDDSEDKKYFPASVLKKVKLATSVIDGLKLLSQSNELKQRLLCLMAPTASADKVQVWAKQFEEQDEAGSGMVKVKDMVSMLIKHQNCSKDEAEQITSSLQALSDGDLVSYSAFLAACLSSHMAKHMKDSDLQGLFKRMDKDHDGTVSLEEVKEVFGDDVIGEEQLKEVMGSKNHLTLSDLRWLLFNPTNEAVHKDKLDGLFKAKEVNRIWKTRGKNQDVRIENYAFRKMAMEKLQGSTDGPTEEEAVRASQQSLESVKMYETASDFKEGFDEIRDTVQKDLAEEWKGATQQAKDDDALEAARKENLAWRMMKKEELEREPSK